MKSIMDEILHCIKCGAACRVGDSIPCADGGSGLGCPVPDCGGMLK